MYESFDYANVDQSSLKRHIDTISLFAEKTNNALAIYDNITMQAVYKSDLYRDFFGENDWDAIHSDDYEAIVKSAIIAFRYFFNGKKNIKEHRLIRRYRAKVKGEFCFIVEQVSALEFDTKGNVWLSLVMIHISPTQSSSHGFEFKIFNVKTGDIITPVSDYIDGKPILSERELDVLKLINQGMLSKEISDKLCISVHTVNTHRQRILKKLEVNTSIEAIQYASAMGIL